MSKIITTKLHIQKKINDLILYGRKEITTRKELEKFPIGSLISYTTKNEVFKYGGYLCKVKNDWFIYITLDFSQKIRTRYVNIDKMWVGDVFKVVGDAISFKKPNNETNYSVSIGKYIVYYGTKNGNSKSFMASQKYKNMLQWHEYFHEN